VSRESAQSDRRANQAFAVYAAHIRAMRANPALFDDPQWQAKREEILGQFLTAFGVTQ
jgi:hypothetical protein